MTTAEPETPTIAVVDDDEAVRSAIENLVRSLGLHAVVFASAEDFLVSGNGANANCLIADVQMPGMSGVELQGHLAAMGNRMPVILITAFPKDYVRAQAESNGAVAYLSTPFDARVLVDCIDRALSAERPTK
jgi:FixJ family two-component response regulator